MNIDEPIEEKINTIISSANTTDTKLLESMKVSLNRCDRYLKKADKWYNVYTQTKDEKRLQAFIEYCEELKILIDLKSSEERFPLLCRKYIEESGLYWVDEFIFS